MRIFITGGLGFIGSYLSFELTKSGHTVFVYDKTINFSNNSGYYSRALNFREKMFLTKPSKVYQDDIRSGSHILRALNDCRPEIVVHLAAVAMARPPKKYEHLMGPINLYGTLNVLKAFEKCESTRRIVFPSSSMAYGHFTKVPQPEESILKPVNEYGIMKAACEFGVQLSKKEWVILRPTSIYGYTDAANRVTQLLWDAAIHHIPAWVVAGESLDFTYIKDAVVGFTRAITSPHAAGQIFNISYGQARTSAEFATCLKKYFPDFNFEIRKTTSTIVNRGVQDISKARKILGFKPKYSIEDGIKDTIRLMKKFGQI